jgi:hypothetical protein
MNKNIGELKMSYKTYTLSKNADGWEHRIYNIKTHRVKVNQFETRLDALNYHNERTDNSFRVHKLFKQWSKRENKNTGWFIITYRAEYFMPEVAKKIGMKTVNIEQAKAECSYEDFQYDYKNTLIKILSSDGYFTSKQQQKDVLGYVSYMYDKYSANVWRDLNHDKFDQFCRDKKDNKEKLSKSCKLVENWSGAVKNKSKQEMVYTYDIPMSLHHIKIEDKEYLDMKGYNSKEIFNLLELRNQIKDYPILPPQQNKEQEFHDRVLNNIKQKLDNTESKIAQGLDLVEMFGYMDVSCDAHYVTNQYGTTFIRHFFYLNGCLTALKTIQATYFQAVEKGLLPKPDWMKQLEA